MADVRDAMAYLIGNYPEHMRGELSNARLTKMVYLSDWHSCLRRNRQITSIDWYFDNFGPFVRDIEETARANPDLFGIDVGQNMYGAPKKSFFLKQDYAPVLTESEVRSLDHIIKVTSKLYWDKFIKLVYSTYPIASSERYEHLDLREKAREYKALKAA